MSDPQPPGDSPNLNQDPAGNSQPSPDSPESDPPQVPKVSSIDRGIEAVQLAIAADHAENYREALKYYQNSLDWFMLALKYEKKDAVKELLRKKITEYLTRAELLKTFLDSDPKDRRGGTGGSGAGRGDKPKPQLVPA